MRFSWNGTDGKSLISESNTSRVSKVSKLPELFSLICIDRKLFESLKKKILSALMQHDLPPCFFFFWYLKASINLMKKACGENYKKLYV